ncbi:MAG: hypothetical protein GXN92_00770 [Candidatus Micrarchaeota archaeon]|nr:hypothetical protein [Candidatus Micrarchaeota archaeon]
MDILTLILLLALGYLSKHLGYLNGESAKHFLRYVFYIGFPALTFYSILNLNFTLTTLYLVIANILLTILLTHIAIIIGQLLKLPPKELGTFIAISVIMNYSVIYVFGYKLFGELGLSYMAFFTFGHTLSALTYTYMVIKRYNPDTVYDSWFKMVWDILTVPLVLSVILGVTANLLELSLPAIVLEVIQMLGNSSIPVVLVALGLLIEFKEVDKWALAGSLLRVVGGGLLGALIAYILPIDDPIQKWTIIIGGMAPVGFMSAVYSEIENLRPKMAANAISISLVLSIALLSLLSIIGEMMGWW